MKTTVSGRFTAVLLSALVSLAGFQAAEAGVDVWTANGPEGGSVSALAIDPQTPTTLYAGTRFDGVFKSTDGGGTWSASNTGLPQGRSVDALAIDPQTPTTLYVGTFGGVFKSTDSGDACRVGHGLGASLVDVLAIDQRTTPTVYPGTPGGALQTDDGGGPWTTTDACPLAA